MFFSYVVEMRKWVENMGKLLFQEFHPFNEAFFFIMISSLLYQPDIFNFVQQTKTNVKMKCNLEGKKAPHRRGI